MPPLVCALLLFVGCAATTANGAEGGQEGVVTRPLVRNDQSEQPIDIYHNSSEPSIAGQNLQRLQSIESFLQSGNSDTAKRVADAINPADLSSEQRLWLSLLHAQILLDFGEAEQAINNLAMISPQQLSLDNQIKYYQSLAFAYPLTGNLLEGAKSRINLHQLIPSAEQREKNQAAIIEALRLLPDNVLQTRQTDILGGWLSLSYILKYISQPNFNARISQWRAAFPTHPADLGFLELPESMPETAPESAPLQGNAIAVLLPESGTFAQQGKAIRAGFMAAYDRSNGNTKPAVHFYDTEQSAPQALYHQAVAEGAQLVIGPLAKEQIQILADTTILNTPLLALNHIPGLQKNNLYQFGLSPLDDTGQITHKARIDGHQKILLLVPDNAPGQRIANYLSKDWQDQDGAILETQAYNPKETDFSVPIQKLLNLDESQHRYNKILALIPGVKYTPRRRQDADAILLGAYSSEARSINPQLQFYQAGDIPVYAMPTVYAGQANASLDADLNKITFCDIPWLFNKAYQEELSMDALKETWKPFSNAYLRLFAMGIDAYNLSARLDSLEANPYPGATGELSLAFDQRIKRKLICARFVNGRPEISGFTPDNYNNAVLKTN